jgi:hypothetical protein
MGKRDALIKLTTKAKMIPTLVITTNPTKAEHHALIDAGLAQRRVLWFSTWNRIIDWCMQKVNGSSESGRLLSKIILPDWIRPAPLGNDWWAAGLLRSCQEYVTSGDFALRQLALPPVLNEAPIGIFSNTSIVKPTWYLTAEILDICTSARVSKWSEYVHEENAREIILKASALCHILVNRCLRLIYLSSLT